MEYGRRGKARKKETEPPVERKKEREIETERKRASVERLFLLG